MAWILQSTRWKTPSAAGLSESADVEHVCRWPFCDLTADVINDHVLGRVQPGIRALLGDFDIAEVESFFGVAKSFSTQ